MNDKLGQVLQKQKQQIAEPTSRDSEEVEQLVGFIVGEEEFAIPILYIKEIIKPIEYTRVPSVPEYVLGVFNLRGSVIPLIDLRVKFNLNPSKMTANTRYIVMKDDDNNIAGFVIDRLTEAIRINKNRIDQPPETLAKDKGMIEGIGKRDNNILTILKVEALLKRDF
ncbi:purine-binding chemotaxis protein CheW [Campylobacter iguaniorum]|uniref:chemotaxis protein CheW n=1 Tax=Campylobacter iguaniorum TaxID=1244531 RepID=UPI0007C95DE7|nr:chemotaxis protein CheW [Campylobacter iguaniorum]ANE35379.1 purine-binding chemotaxis protein CheW [Campylobacter iguaniorum]